MQWKVYDVKPFQWSNEQRKEIEQIAYYMWIDAGKPSGRDLEFWTRAETKYLFPQPVRTIMAEGFYLCPDGTWKGSMNPREDKDSDPAKPILTRYGKKLQERCTVTEEV